VKRRSFHRRLLYNVNSNGANACLRYASVSYVHAVNPQSKRLTFAGLTRHSRRLFTQILCCLIVFVLTFAIWVTAGYAGEPSPVFLTNDGRLKQRPAWSPDGKSLVFARHHGSKITLFVIAADGTNERRLTKRDEPQYDAVFSPDGKRLVFAHVKTSPNQGDVDVYTIRADGKELKPLVVTDGKLSHEESPTWSPDGKRIAFSSTRDGNQELYVIGIDGKDRKRLTNHNAIDAHPTWSPDGKRIVFATNRWGDLELAAIELGSQSVTRLTDSRGLDDYPAFSPDGKRLAFTSNRDGNPEIYVANADGTDPRNMTQNPAIDNFPTWSPEGRLTFVTNRADGFDICIMPKPAAD
jgi:TolB protein